MSYWYHFAIMFEAMFILTTIDTGTRVARFLVQESFGKIFPKLGRTDWLPGTLFTSALVVCAWSYFIVTGSISTIWPMFGTANQLLACISLCIVTTYLFNTGRSRYVWVTMIPMVFVGITTLSASVLNIRDNFWPLTHNPVTAFNGYLLSFFTLVMIGCVFAIFITSIPKWFSGKPRQPRVFV